MVMMGDIDGLEQIENTENIENLIKVTEERMRLTLRNNTMSSWMENLPLIICEAYSQMFDCLDIRQNNATRLTTVDKRKLWSN